LVKLEPSGIPGTTRSIFTDGLLALLAAAAFYFLVFCDAPKAPEYADKIITVLAGAVSSIIGFYFGSKATSEGIATGAAQREEKPTNPGGRIARIDPPKSPSGQVVTIEGTGFGDTAGNVHFITTSAGTISAPQAVEWHPTLIKVEIPTSLPKGKAVIAVNPSHGARIVATDNTPFEIV
jgi:IPT/TIG domain